MRRIEYIEFAKALNEIEINDFNKFLVYAIKLTKIKTQKFIDEVIEKEKELFFPEYVNVESMRIKILEKFSKKDEDGKPIIKNDIFQVEDQESCSKELREHYESNKEIFEKHLALRKEYEKFMEEEIEPAIVKTSFVNIPQNIKDEIQYNVLNMFVKETEEEIEKLLG